MRRLSYVLLAALAAAGCKKDDAVVVAAPLAPAGAPATAAQAGASPGEAQPSSAAPPIAGKLLERIDASPYSYLRLQTAQGEVWAAVEKTDLPKGADVAVNGPLPMKDFESKTLKRKFALVYFGSLSAPGAAPGAAPAANGALPAGHPAVGAPAPGGDMGGAMAPGTPMPPHGGAAAAAIDAGDVKVAKASGPDARSIAELHAQKAALKDKSVTVHGKVVKYNGGIMGKNWLHLRDGTGKAGADDDLTVTTQDVAAVGEVVTVKGKLAVDQDIGMGTPYPVLIEDAKVEKK